MPGNLLDKPVKSLEFCKSRKVGTLIWTLVTREVFRYNALRCWCALKSSRDLLCGNMITMYFNYAHVYLIWIVIPYSSQVLN